MNRKITLKIIIIAIALSVMVIVITLPNSPTHDDSPKLNPSPIPTIDSFDWGNVTYVIPTHDLYLGQNIIIKDCTGGWWFSSGYGDIRSQGSIYISDGKGGYVLTFKDVVYYVDKSGVVQIWR